MDVNDDEDDVKECECCGYITDSLKEYRRGTSRTEHIMLCEICAGTYASHFVQYPDLLDESVGKAVRSMAWMANMLRDEIRSLRQAIRQTANKRKETP